MSATDAVLRAVAQGDRTAFAQLYRSSRAGLLRYATGLLAGDHAAAEDAVDDAFVAIWAQAGRFAATGSAEGWMRRIVRNKAIDWLRKQRETPMSGDPVMAAAAEAAADDGTPVDMLMQGAAAATLREMLGLLSFEQREAVWLCYFEDKSITEIAEISRCPENTVKTRLFHARRILGKAPQVRDLHFAA